MKRLAILGTNGLPPKYGGFETLVDNLTKIEVDDLEYVVFCSKTKKEDRLTRYNQATLEYINLNANGLQSISYDIISLLKTWFTFDYILLLGTPGSPIIPLLKLLRKKTIIATNFGGLEWKRDKWNWFVRKYLKFSERIAIKYSDIIVADNQHFVNYIKKKYNKESTLIEYGGDHAGNVDYTKNDLIKFPFLEKPYGINISRAQPDNLLHLVLEAFKENPDNTIVIVSNWDNFQYGRNLKKKYSNYKNIFIIDAIYDLNELNMLRSNASYYIHSHTFCGTAPSLVEAMYLGLPIISFDAETNRYTTEEKALFFEDLNYLSSIIKNFDKVDLKTLGLKMKEVAERRYTWKTIGQKYISIFKK